MGDLPALPRQLRVSLDGEAPRVVPTERYVIAKTRALKEFGYSNLQTATVREQLQHVLAGHTMDNGLDVVGMFIKRDLADQ